MKTFNVKNYVSLWYNLIYDLLEPTKWSMGLSEHKGPRQDALNIPEEKYGIGITQFLFSIF